VSSAIGGGSAKVAATMAANLTRSEQDAHDRLLARHLKTAERMAEVLGTMKGAAMKLGQLASFVELEFIPDEFRPLYQEKLASLRDAAPAMDWRRVERALRQEWGERPDRVLAEIDTDAAAAASVGQVHRAVLEDGRQVAVKVQYPGVAEAIRADLQNVGLLTQLAKVLAPGLDARAIAREIRERVLEELDYEYEAQMQRRFARAYRGHPFVHVPPVVTDLSRTRVLVTEWVDGHGFAEVKRRPAAERDRFGEVLFRFYYGSMHRLGIYNADPHPGNYLLLRDGRVAFVDFGSTREVAPDRLAKMSEFCLAASERDAERAKRALVELGYLVRPDTVDASRLMDSADAIQGWFLTDREVTIDAELVRRTIAAANDPRAGFFDLMRRATLPHEDVLMRRLDAGVVAVLGQLRATCNWHRIAREYWTGERASTELGQADAAFFAARAGV
jgi:predicted unusual protein kinase regulating ubiquinone biosynthesis (AarF/ABC1/UbiB family)